MKHFWRLDTISNSDGQRINGRNKNVIRIKEYEI